MITLTCGGGVVDYMTSDIHQLALCVKCLLITQIVWKYQTLASGIQRELESQEDS